MVQSATARQHENQKHRGDADARRDERNGAELRGRDPHKQKGASPNSAENDQLNPVAGVHAAVEYCTRARAPAYPGPPFRTGNAATSESFSVVTSCRHYRSRL